MSLAFGSEVRRLRRERALTQEQLAEDSNLSVDCVRRLERGLFAPTLTTLRKLSAGLKLPLSTIFSELESGGPPSSLTGPRLHEFIDANREEIMRRWELRMRELVVPEAMATLELRDSLVGFLEFAACKIREALGDASCAREPEPSRAAVQPVVQAQNPIAEEHSRQRLRGGFNIGAVVREFAALQEAVLELAQEAEISVTEAEEAAFSKCIAAGTADAVTEFTRQRDELLERQAAEHFAFIAHELRNPMASVSTSVGLLRRKSLVAPEGSHHLDRVERGLGKLRVLIDSTLVTLRTQAGVRPVLESLRLQDVLAEAEIESAADAAEKRVNVRVEVEPEGEVEADRRLLLSAVTNLLGNALKFTPPGGQVTLRARITDERLALIEVEDGCLGLPPGAAERLFTPYVQAGLDRSGFGLGLSIAKLAIQAHNGNIRVTDLPGRGCIFTLELPASAPAPT